LHASLGNAFFSVDTRARFPTIFVAQSDVPGVRVVLGAKGGILVGDVRDRNLTAQFHTAKSYCVMLGTLMDSLS